LNVQEKNVCGVCIDKSIKELKRIRTNEPNQSDRRPRVSKAIHFLAQVQGAQLNVVVVAAGNSLELNKDTEHDDVSHSPCPEDVNEGIDKRSVSSLLPVNRLVKQSHVPLIGQAGSQCLELIRTNAFKAQSPQRAVRRTQPTTRDVLNDGPRDAVLGCYNEMGLAGDCFLKKGGVHRRRASRIGVAYSVVARVNRSLRLAEQHVVRLTARLQHRDGLEPQGIRGVVVGENMLDVHNLHDVIRIEPACET
jgi:hypothetical protein